VSKVLLAEECRRKVRRIAPGLQFAEPGQQLPGLRSPPSFHQHVRPRPDLRYARQPIPRPARLQDVGLPAKRLPAGILLPQVDAEHGAGSKEHPRPTDADALVERQNVRRMTKEHPEIAVALGEIRIDAGEVAHPAPHPLDAKAIAPQRRAVRQISRLADESLRSMIHQGVHRMPYYAKL